MSATMPDRHFAVKPLAHHYAQLTAARDMPARHCVGMDRVRKLRDARKLTQTQLAGMIGVNQATISKIEKGIANPTQTMITRLAAALGVDPVDLFAQGDLEARALDALKKMPPDRRQAALAVLEAMATAPDL